MGTTMKENISCYDRVQALIRSPEYLKDLKEYYEDEDKYFDPNYFYQYGLYGPVNPEELKNLQREDYCNEDFFVYEEIVKIISIVQKCLHGSDSRNMVS